MYSLLRIPRIRPIHASATDAAVMLGLASISTLALAFGTVSYLTVTGAAVALYLLFHDHGVEKGMFLGLCGFGATTSFVAFSRPEEAWTLESLGKSITASGAFIGATVALFARDCGLPDHTVYKDLLQSSVYAGLLVAAVLLLVGGFDLAVDMRSRMELAVLAFGAAYFTSINAGGVLGKGLRRFLLGSVGEARVDR